MFPSVGAVRKSGTTVIIEDVAFPIERLADAALDLTKLFAKHGYDNAIIFGHAKDGNLHFVLTQSFNDQSSNRSVRAVHRRRGRSGRRTVTTARSRPSTAPGATWRRSSRPSGVAKRTR